MRATRREWVGLAVLALPTLIVTMDLSVLFLAVPKLTEDLQPTSSELLWITDVYGLLIAASLITMGTLGDRIGRRRLLLIGGRGLRGRVPGRRVRDQPGDADRRAGAARGGGRDPGAVVPGADPDHVRGARAAPARDRDLDQLLRRRRRARPGDRRRPAGALLVGLGVPPERPRDGAPARRAAPPCCPSRATPTRAGSTSSARGSRSSSLLAVIYGVTRMAEHGPGPAAAARDPRRRGRRRGVRAPSAAARLPADRSASVSRPRRSSSRWALCWSRSS